MYFRSLPKIFYPFKNRKKQTIMPDILRRVQLDKFFNNRIILEKYYVKDYETPEVLAHKFYGQSEYHWILLLANNIIDVNREWPQAQEEVIAYTKDKYGSTNMTDIHHWVLKEDKSIIVDWSPEAEQAATIESVSNLDYETDINEKKRQIAVVPEADIKNLVETYKRLVR